MAEASISVDQDQFVCPVCLDLLEDPVTTRCGHSFCKVCINDHWDQEDWKGVHSCPQCRDTFTPRPVLRRNNMLAEVVAKLKNSEVQAPSPAHSYAGPGDVACDFCTGNKHKAVKSCLVCVVFLCETHLKPHLEIPALKSHTLAEASAQVQDKICSEHNKLMEIYCRTDRSLVCYMCTMGKHKGHDTVTASGERAEKQSELKVEQMKFQQRIQEKQEKVQELKQAVNNIQISAQTALVNNEKIFTEMIRFLVKKRSEVREMIRDQEKAELSRAERHLEKLEQEILELQRRIAELEQLSHIHDHIHFLQRFQSLGAGRRSPPLERSDSDTSSSITVRQHHLSDGLKNYLSNLKKRLEEFCGEKFSKIPPQVQCVHSEPQSREEFMKYYCYLTLDPNTAHRNLVLSEKNRVVKFSEKEQQYLDHPERFDSWEQVLSKESLYGRCYWEAERRSLFGSGLVSISVTYKDISRKGQSEKCRFGHNKQSWSLRCSSSSLCFHHNNIKTDLGVPAPARIGVYVDHSAGTLSFYSVSDNMKLLHSIQTTFAQPLYAGFGPCLSSVRFCDPELM